MSEKLRVTKEDAAQPATGETAEVLVDHGDGSPAETVKFSPDQIDAIAAEVNKGASN